MRRFFRLTSSIPDVARDVRSEIEFHLDMRTRELVEAGYSPQAARTAAVEAFGDVAAIEADCRGAASRTVRTRARRATMTGMTQDLRYAVRTLKHNPGYTLVALLTLALGIGANTAIFSMIRGVLLRPLPYHEGERLVFLEQPASLAGVQDARFSVPELADYRAQSRTLQGIVEYHSMPFILLGDGEPSRVQTGVVSANFFDVLGVTPQLGRAFREGEDQPGANPVLMLSHGYWMSRLGGDPAVIGRTFEMNDRIHTVIGVLPPVPQYPAENDVYMPASSCPFRMNPGLIQNRSGRMLTLFGRLAPGQTVQTANTEFGAIASRLRAQYPQAYPSGQGFSVRVASLQEEMGRRARPTLLLLLGTAGFVLLIACANVANLTLARLMRRERELALRAALGADRGRLIRQLFAEGGLLALAGGLLGLALAAGAMGLLTAFAARFTPRASEISLDGTVLAFTLVVSLVTGLAFALLPALPAKVNLVGALRDGGSATSGGRTSRARSALVVVQVAVSVVLLVGAGLMLRSLIALQHVDPGFNPERVLTMTLDLNWSRYTTPDLIRNFHDRLLTRLESQPGVVAAASTLVFPLGSSRTLGFEFEIEGRPRDPQVTLPQGDFRSVSPDYFRTLGIPLVTGRLFTSTDAAESPQVAIVNRSLAQHYWGEQSPLGRRISADSGKTWVTVVGVVGDVRHYGLDRQPTDELYMPFSQVPIREGSLLVRTTGEPHAAASIVQEEIKAIDPDQPIANVESLEELRGESLASPRLTASLLVMFAALALLITGAGLAGLVAFSVSQRTQEIGVRMALGAERSEVLSMVLGEGMRLVFAGLVLGVAGALAATRLMSGLLYGVTATDPITFLVVSAVLALVALAACLVPARRATTVDPMVALRTA